MSSKNNRWLNQLTSTLMVGRRHLLTAREVPMPRRRPGEIRAQLQRRTYGVRPPVIPSLSAATNHQIAAYERRRGLRLGTVTQAFDSWAKALSHHPDGSLSLGYGTTPWHDMHARTLLDDLCRTLRRQARRELVRALTPLDDRVLSRTVNNPKSTPDEPWWKRRIES